METIFTVKNEDLERLSPQEAIDFFRELLWAEATKCGIGKNLINVPSAITVADGSIDAEVQGVPVGGGEGIIKQGLTRYQIKTGNFSLSNESHIKSILFKKGTSELKPRIKSCLDQNGTLVVVLFGWDRPEAKDDQFIKKFKEKLTSIHENYSNTNIEICQQNKLIGFLKLFPSLALEINLRGKSRFQTHQSWAQEAEMKREFNAGPTQVDYISKLQTELRRDDVAVHVRIWGEPGIGKTRVVLEATRSDDLRPIVIYCDSASKFRDSDLMNEVLKNDNQFSAILVIDECDPDSRSYLWNKLKYCGPRIKLVSIYDEYDDTAGNITYFNVPPLEKEQVCMIIQGYGISKDQIDRWLELCSGSPRVAHVIGWNLKNNPEDLLKPPDTINVWDRYIVGGDDPASQEVQQRQLVLRHLALFKRFGYGRPVVNEAQAIVKMIAQADMQLTWPKFQEVVTNLKTRKILHGENTLYISPKALHIKLWIDWWNTYGDTFNLDDFSTKLPPKLLEWFYEMFKYAAESEVASKVVKELLGADGLFRNNNYLKTKHGSRFFLALAEADTKSALECLKKTVGTWSKEELLQFTTGRREVVWSLEKIAIWKDLFVEAARLLLSLSEAENETYSNNASGVFAGFFTPAPGSVAPTEASPQERFVVLKEALESDSKERRVIALRACDRALDSQYFVRTIGAEYQGLRKEPQLWMPKTYEELFDAYQQVWQLLRERLDNLLEDEQEQAVNILLEHARGLGGIKDLTDMVIDTVNELAKKPYVDKKKLLTKIAQILHYDGKKLLSQTRQRWEQLKDEITGNSFSSLMHRYVGMNLLEDRFDEHGNLKDQTQPRIEELARQAIGNRELLQPELGWLVSTEALNGYSFGYQLGKSDKDFSILPIILEAQRNTGENLSTYFLGGYLRVVFEKDKELWENQLDDLIKDKKLNVCIPELTWRSGISDRAALRILNLAQEGIIDRGYFRIFCYGSIIQELSENIFKKWIEFLLDSSDANAISIALALYSFYYLHKDSEHALPEGLTLALLMHESLFQKFEGGRRDQMDEYHWTEIGKAFVLHYPEKSLDLGDKMLQHFGENGTILEGFYSQTQEVINQIIRLHPSEIWERVTKYLGPPFYSHTFNIKEWLRGHEFFGLGGESVLTLVPVGNIWEWVDADVEKRAKYLASFVPNKLFQKEGKICLAREVLVRYGHREDVRRNLNANFSTEGWSGPASFHYQSKKQQLLEFKKGEVDENVKRWIDQYVTALDREIERTKIEEEREDY